MADMCDVLVVGGGFYGLYLAATLAERYARVRLVEREAGLMRRASYANQARIHGGYHYPRSVLTAGRSRANYPRFVAEFREAATTTFDAVYAIARIGSLITAEQFAVAMQRIGAPIATVPTAIRNLFDSARIEDVFLVEEAAFDSARLRQMMVERAMRAGVTIHVGTTATRVRPLASGLRVELTDGTNLETGQVFVCGYSGTNAISAASGLPLIPLKHELAEMALVQVPESLRGLGITVMDGPFFSCMPFPPRRLHTLSHVRYTPHGHWFESEDGYRGAEEIFTSAEKRTAFSHMVRDAARFMPALAGSEYRDSLWEVKTVLPRSESDDSRPILFRADHGLPGFHVVMGGKIDNIYDVACEILNR